MNPEGATYRRSEDYLEESALVRATACFHLPRGEDAKAITVVKDRGSYFHS